MEATINNFYDNSMGYDSALSMRSLWQPSFQQSQVTTSAYEISGSPVVGFSESTPKPILIRLGRATPPWMLRAAKDMEEIMRLEDNWDTYGARPVQHEIAIEGLRLLSEIMKVGVSEPSVVPVPTGGIQLEWHKNGKHFEVELLSPTKASFYFEDDENEQEIEDEGILSTLKPKIRDLLSKVFS